jgi:hypothetical protein
MPFHTGTFFFSFPFSFLFFSSTFFFFFFFSSTVRCRIVTLHLPLFYILFFSVPAFLCPALLYLPSPLDCRGISFLLCTRCSRDHTSFILSFHFFSFFFFFLSAPPPPPAPFGTDRLAGIEACMQSSYHG